MFQHPYVASLLAFEQQRLGTPIVTLDADGEPDDDASRVVLLSPASLSVATALRDFDGRTVELRTSRPLDGATPHASAGIVVASTVGHVVHLCIDPDALAEDRPLLATLWDGVAGALSEAAVHATARLERSQLASFINAEEHVWREALRRLPGEIDNAEYAVTRLEGQMRDQAAKLFELRCRYRAMQVALPEAVRQAATEQHAVLRRLVPNVYRRITVSDGAIVAELGSVVIEHEGDEVEVGDFEVRVSLSSGEVSLRNTSNVVNGIHHPHVRNPEDVCWGNVRGSIARLASEREWGALLIATQRFLTSFTEGDSYQGLSAWSGDHSNEDDEYDQDDEEDESDEGVECSLCLEPTASDEITHVGTGSAAEPVCLACYERDVFTCACCRRQFTTRQQARESTQCLGCWTTSRFTCPRCEAVKPVSDRASSGACVACASSDGGVVPTTPVAQEAS